MANAQSTLNGKPENFIEHFTRELESTWYKVEVDNIDEIRFPCDSKNIFIKARRYAKNNIFCILAKRNFIYFHNVTFQEFIGGLRDIFENSHKFNEIYGLFEHDLSRKLMVKLILYRMLGNEKVRLPLSNSDYWNQFLYIENQLLQKKKSYKINSLDGYLNLYRLNPIDFPILLNAHQLNIVCTFMLKQYKYNESGISIEAEDGDFVIDAGGCWGDTALYFANNVGDEGKVFCFEFSESNLNILNQNLELNPILKNRISVIKNPIWNISDESLFFDERGSGTSLVLNKGSDSSVLSKSIDDFVDEIKLAKVDFIKMDIEGAELRGLKGAEKTLRKFRPKLAISVYHCDEDIINIPDYLNQLNIGYKFFLNHFTIHREETVLFAKVC